MFNDHIAVISIFKNKYLEIDLDHVLCVYLIL